MGNFNAKESDKEFLKYQIKNFNDRLEVALIKCGQAKKTFVTLSDMWSASRLEVIETLSAIANDIDRNHLNVNIACLSGTTSSIAGGTSAIAGLILAPVSGGVSLILTAGSLLGTVAGTATTLGANVVEVLLTKDLMEKAKRSMEIDTMYSKALSDSLRELIIHENEVMSILNELQSEVLIKDLEKVAKLSPHSNILIERANNLRNGANPLEGLLALISCLYPDDGEFLKNLNSTNSLFHQMPSLSATMSTTTEFFQALKELSASGPETVKGITETILQTSMVTTTQTASLGAQFVTGGLSAVFVLLDLHNLLRTKQNYDQGSKTELAENLRNLTVNLQKEQEQVNLLSNFYKQKLEINF